MSNAVEETRDFFSSAERILFDVISWVILIPKTLYLVLAHPGDVPDYVKRELAADRAKRFENGISPVFLYLIVALGPFLVIQLIPLSQVEITVQSPTQVMVPTTLSVQIEDLTSLPSDSVALEWRVLDENRLWLGDPIRLCVEYMTFPVPCDSPSFLGSSMGDEAIDEPAIEDRPEFQMFARLVRDRG